MLLSQKETHAARAAAALINLFSDTLRTPGVRRAAARELSDGSGVTPADVMLCNLNVLASVLANPTEARLDVRALVRAERAAKVLRSVLRGLCPELAPLVPDVSLTALGGPTQDVCHLFFEGLRDVVEVCYPAGEASPSATKPDACAGPLQVGVLLADGFNGARSYIQSFFPQDVWWLVPGTIDSSAGRRFDVLLVEQGAEGHRIAAARERLWAGGFEMRVVFDPEGVRLAPTP